MLRAGGNKKREWRKAMWSTTHGGGGGDDSDLGLSLLLPGLPVVGVVLLNGLLTYVVLGVEGPGAEKS
ncbi:hypothetical protein BDZ91DRAFT_171153 [Kalaharituber pfeilii]|nr:hypothetical protein BDZ91DRAFT_171153 [Kalaharituber pfeilii]